MKCKIYICTHTDFDCPVTNPIYEILDSRKLFPGDVHSNGLKNLFYSEIASYIYMAHQPNLPQYIGFCQYRKYLSFMDEIVDIPTIIQEHGCIAADLQTRPRSIYKQYAKSFCFADMDITMGIIASLYPDFYKAFKASLEGNVLYPGNMFIMRRDDFLDLMKIISTVLDRLIEVIGTDIICRINAHPHIYLKKETSFPSIPFQYRIGGNIAERITSAYIMQHFPNCKTFPMVFTAARKKFNI